MEKEEKEKQKRERGREGREEKATTARCPPHPVLPKPKVAAQLGSQPFPAPPGKRGRAKQSWTRWFHDDTSQPFFSTAAELPSSSRNRPYCLRGHGCSTPLTTDPFPWRPTPLGSASSTGCPLCQGHYFKSKRRALVLRKSMGNLPIDWDFQFKLLLLLNSSPTLLLHHTPSRLTN